jgi:REP element-mobilizing transposase RayT
MRLDREGFSPRVGSPYTASRTWRKWFTRTFPQPARPPRWAVENFRHRSCCSADVRHPHRLATADYRSAQQCFVTFGTRHRAPLLAQPEVADLVVDALHSTGAAHQLEVTAYSVMPDHVHLLLTSEAGVANIRAAIHGVKQRSGFVYKQRVGSALWHVSYFDRTLRHEDDAVSAWPFSGSTRWSRDELVEFVASAGPGRRPRG